MQASENTNRRSRLGYYYLPDTLHFGRKNAQMWVSELTKSSVNWVLLQAPLERAIPEYFLEPFLENHIIPVLQFDLPTSLLRAGEGLQLLFNHYARIGVEYVIFYDRPNVRQAWSAEIWAQSDLVERFLDAYLPLAELALYEGLTPVFPPLEPGGDYWDLAFLRGALRSMKRRGYQHLLNEMVLGTYARALNRPLDWGMGGLDRWPGARPYASQPGMQDHRGFQIFDWYLDICQQELGRRLPVILLEAGCQVGDDQDNQYPLIDAQAQSERNLSIIRWLHGDTQQPGLSEVVADEILACFFKSSEYFEMENVNDAEKDGSKNARRPLLAEIQRWSAAWQGKLGSTGVATPEILPVSENAQKDNFIFRALKKNGKNNQQIAEIDKTEEFNKSRDTNSEKAEPGNLVKENGVEHEEESYAATGEPMLISHYVLLPLYAWGAAEWDMETIRPLLQEGHPTIGFSLAEASMADRVTVVGGSDVFSEQALDTLRKAGCAVERITDDGTLIAT